MKNISDKFVEKMKAHFMFNNFFSESLVLYQIEPDVERYDTARQATDNNLIWLMRFAC
jgi:hypothetical protein